MNLFERKLNQALHGINVHPILEGYLNLIVLEDTTGPGWPVEWAEEIVSNPTTHKWLAELGFDGEIGSPKSGTVGRAYSVGDNAILKLTTDRKEAQSAAVLRGKPLENAAYVHDVKLLMSRPHWDPIISRTINVFGIVMEKLNIGVGKKWRVAAGIVYQYLDDFSGFIEDPETATEVAIDNYLAEMPKYYNDDDIPNLVRRVMMAVYNVQQQSGVLTQDPHGGNIALKGTEPAFFDFGRSSIDWHKPATDSVGRIEKLSNFDEISRSRSRTA